MSNIGNFAIFKSDLFWKIFILHKNCGVYSDYAPGDKNFDPVAFKIEAIFFETFFFPTGHDGSSSEVPCWVYGVRLGRNVGEILEKKKNFLTKNTLG